MVSAAGKLLWCTACISDVLLHHTHRLQLHCKTKLAVETSSCGMASGWAGLSINLLAHKDVLEVASTTHSDTLVHSRTPLLKSKHKHSSVLFQMRCTMLSPGSSGLPAYRQASCMHVSIQLTLRSAAHLEPSA